MATLEFHRESKELRLLGSEGTTTIGTWNAGNNVDSHSKGRWPDGQYTFDHYSAHPGDPPQSAYGSHGIFIFDVPNREGTGVHSGREGIPDGLSRAGFLHCTMGCIRTTDRAMAGRTHAVDPITGISVAP